MGETIRGFAAEMARDGEPDFVGWADDPEFPGSTVSSSRESSTAPSR